MCKFSIVVQFINTVHPHKRDGLLRSTLDQDDPDIFQNSIFTYYQSRPKLSTDEFKSEDYWNSLCLSEFLANYDIINGNSSPKEIKSRNLTTLQNKKGFIKERRNIKHFVIT